MNKIKLDLQLFAAGMVLSKIALNLRLFDEVITKSTDSEMSAEMKTLYVKDMIRLGGPKLVYEQFFKKGTVPQGRGKKVEWRILADLPKATTQLVEGVPPTGRKPVVSTVEAELAQYGDFIKFTDVLKMTALDPIQVEFLAKLAQQALGTKDTLAREEAVGGTVRLYAPIVSGDTETPVLLRKNITTNAKFSCAMIREMVAQLKRVNATTFENGKYPIVIHTDVAKDLQADTEWKEAHKYNDAEAIWNGYLGSFAGASIHETTEAKILGPEWIFGSLEASGVCRMTLYTPLDETGSVNIFPAETISTEQAAELTARIAAGTVKLYIGGNEATLVSVTAGAAGVGKFVVTEAVTDVAEGGVICGIGAGKDGTAVYMSMAFGMDGAGKRELENGGLQYIAKQLGSAGTADPLDQIATTGWKMMTAHKRLVENYLCRCEHSASYGASAVSN